LKPQFAPNLTGFENLSGFTIFVPVILQLLERLLFCDCFRSCYFAAVFVPNLFCGWLFSFQIYFAMNVVTQ